MKSEAWHVTQQHHHLSSIAGCLFYTDIDSILWLLLLAIRWNNRLGKSKSQSAGCTGHGTIMKVWSCAYVYGASSSDSLILNLFRRSFCYFVIRHLSVSSSFCTFIKLSRHWIFLAYWFPLSYCLKFISWDLHFAVRCINVCSVWMKVNLEMRHRKK